MSSLPAISGKKAIAAFEKAGFVFLRTTGSHHMLGKEGHPYILSVPVHSNKDLKPGTLRSLIRAAGMDVEEFCELL